MANQWRLFILIPKEVENSDWDIPTWHNFIDRWILDEKNRHILKRKYTDNASIETIAEEIELSPRQTQRRFEKAHKQLMKKI